MARSRRFEFLAAAIAFIAVAAFGQAQREGGPAGTPVLIRCDTDCLLRIDGAQAQSLSASDTKLIPLSSGQRLMLSVPRVGTRSVLCVGGAVIRDGDVQCEQTSSIFTTYQEEK